MVVSVPCRGSISFYSTFFWIIPTKISFCPLSGFYEFLWNRKRPARDLGLVSVPCRGSISFYEYDDNGSVEASEVSVPCRGSISFYWDIEVMKRVADAFPSPVGVLWVSMGLQMCSWKTACCFRPLPGFCEFLCRSKILSKGKISFRPLPGAMSFYKKWILRDSKADKVSVPYRGSMSFYGWLRG